MKRYFNYIKKNRDEIPNLDKLTDNPNLFLEDHQKYWKGGLKMIAKGRVALVLLAGGSDIKWGGSKTPFGL